MWICFKGFSVNGSFVILFGVKVKRTKKGMQGGPTKIVTMPTSSVDVLLRGIPTIAVYTGRAQNLIEPDHFLSNTSLIDHRVHPIEIR
jgi:hypothetical protein